MKPKLLALVALVGVLSGGLFVMQEIGAYSRPGRIVEERVNANLMRVRVGNRIEEFPMMPLAERACQSGDSHFERYCD